MLSRRHPTNPRKSIPAELIYSSVSELVPSQISIAYQPSPQATASSTSPQTLIIEMPPGNKGTFIDWSKAYLDMSVKLDYTNSAGGTPYFKQGIGCLFKNVRVFIGSRQIENIVNYNNWQQILAYSECSPDLLDSNWQEGLYSAAATAQSWHATTGTSRYYSHKLKIGLMSIAKLFPSFAMPRVRIELDMASTSQAVVNPGTNTGISYTINNLRLVYESYKPDIEYLDAFEQKLVSEGIEIPFPTITAYQSALTNSGSNDYFINDVSVSAKGLIWAGLLQSNFGSSTADYQYIPDGLQTWFLKIGSQVLPNFQLQFPEICYEEYLKTVGMGGRYAGLNSLTYPNYTNTGSPTAYVSFQGLNLENYNSQSEISGMNLKASNGVVLTTTYASGGADSLTLLVYVIKDCVLRVFADQELIVSM